jgi:hypothetical protein
MGVRLVFKDRAEARKEHVTDRFNQVKDNWAFLVEEHTASKREALYRRLYGDISDLLRVDPDNLEARRYWADIGYSQDQLPPFVQPVAPAGMPLGRFASWRTSSSRASSSTGGSTTGRCPMAISAAFRMIPT